MIEFLKRPYKETGNSKRTFLSIAAFGLFIFLFLYLFKPFGLYELKPSQQLFITMGFGLITFAVLIIFKFLIEPVVIGERWTFGKNILWDILIASSIGAANYLYMMSIFDFPFRLIYLLYSVWTAILVGSIPVTVIYFIKYNQLYRNALKEADIPDENLTWEEEVKITAGYPRNELTVNPKQIVYLCSNDNYVTIVTNKDNVRKRTTLRGTLKDAEAELCRNRRLMRCHKCYIVNLDYAEKTTGNNQNMKIRLSVPDIDIPVARSKAVLIGSRIRKLRSR
jgi:hypothetical protein